MLVFALTVAILLLLSGMDLVWELLTASRVSTEGHGLRLPFPREALHERCAPRNSELGLPGTT